MTLNSEGLEKAWCATDGCGRPATQRFEAGGVGSDHCDDCAKKIRAARPALPPVDGLEVVGAVEFLLEAAVYFSNRPTGGEDMAHWSNVLNAENCTKAASFLSQASSVIAGLKAERDEARRGEYAANEHEPTWDELTSVWKARAETAEQEAKARLDALNQVGLTPEQKSWVDSFLKTRAFLSARQALEDHNG